MPSFKFYGKLSLSGHQFVFFFLAISILISASCSQSQDEAAWFQTSSTGEILAPEIIQNLIDQTNSLFVLQEMRREYILKGGDSREIMAQLEFRRDQLVLESKVIPVIKDKLNFVAWDINHLDKNKFRISCYFVVTGKMDRDWVFKLIGKVDKKHNSLLPPEDQNTSRQRWQVFPKTSTWEPGEHKIISQEVELKPIPYNIMARFYLYPEKQFEEVFQYGWFNALQNSPHKSPMQ